MIDWLAIVRVADYDAIRWALPAFSADPFPVQPVHLRIAQNWVWRMHQIGYVDRARPTHSAGTIIWPTYLAVGRSKPNLFRQTTRHEVLVARVSAHYLAHGYSWARDRRPHGYSDHQADGVATRDGSRELIEIELTPKTRHRYTQILNNHGQRLEEGFTRIIYFCTPQAATAVTREADRILILRLRARFDIVRAINVDGKWEDNEVVVPRSDESCPSSVHP